MRGRLIKVVSPISIAFASCSLGPAIAAQQVSAPSAAVDITNQRQAFSATLDVNGQTQSSFWFSISSPCRVTVEHPRPTGFTVAYWVESVNGTKMFGSLMGTNPRPRSAMLGPGRYRFVAAARREAGFYEFAISTYCN